MRISYGIFILPRNTTLFGFGSVAARNTAEQHSTNKSQSGISAATITLTDEAGQLQRTGKTADETVAGLNRNVTTGLDGSNTLAPNFNRQEIEAGFAITAAFNREVGTFLVNRAKEADTLERQAREVQVQLQDPALSDEARRALQHQISALKTEAREINGVWGMGGSGRIVLSALTGGLNGNVTGSGSELIQSVGANYLQSLAAAGIKVIADQLDSETARTALHAVTSCAGAAAQGQKERTRFVLDRRSLQWFWYGRWEVDGESDGECFARSGRWETHFSDHTHTSPRYWQT